MQAIKRKENEEEFIPIPPARVRQAVMTAHVTIRGLSALLMSSKKKMIRDQIEPPIKTVGTQSEVVNPREEAELRSYRMYKGGWEGPLCVPTNCVKRNLIEAVKVAKYTTMDRKKMRGGFSMVQKVKGSIKIVSYVKDHPEVIPLIHTDGSPVEDYVVNIDTVRLKATGGTVVRYRPQIDDWGLRFMIQWNPHLYELSAGVFSDLLNRGGNMGLLDNRPEFGLYDAVEFRLDDVSLRMEEKLEAQEQASKKAEVDLKKSDGKGRKGKKKTVTAKDDDQDVMFNE